MLPAPQLRYGTVNPYIVPQTKANPWCTDSPWTTVPPVVQSVDHSQSVQFGPVNAD